MVTNQSEVRPIAIVGSGQSAVATIINKLVDIAYNRKDRLPANVMVIDSLDKVRHEANSAYPLKGHPARDLHPFFTDTPPQGFPTFGEYVDEMVAEDPSLVNTLTAPTWQQVNDYTEYMLELAVMAVADKAATDSTAKTIEAIEETVDPAVTRHAWERLLRVAEDFHYARCAYGRLLERMGEFAGAEAALREVLSRAEDDPASQAMATDCHGEWSGVATTTKAPRHNSSGHCSCIGSAAMRSGNEPRWKCSVGSLTCAVSQRTG